MRARTLLALALLSFPASLSAQQATDPASRVPANHFDVQQVADGVYAVIRKDPPGLMFDANVVFIVGEHDVVVVDTNVGPASAREVIAALRALTDRPVRYVVNTHWHEDHILGNQVYRDTFPGVEFIGHASTLTDLPATGAANRRSLIEGAPPFIAHIRQQMAQGRSLAGTPLTEAERASYTSDIALVERYLAEAPGFEVVLPTLTVTDRLTLHRGGRVIDILHLGRAHTAADLVVHLPRENVLITGDLVVWPVPLVGSTSYPLDYGATLERLLALRPAVMIPGHGPVLRDDAYVRLLVRLLASLKEQTEATVARGETLEQARRSVKLDELRRLVAGDSPLLGFIFDNYVVSSGIAAAYRQATARP